MEDIKLNKKADITITLLVLACFAIFLFALFTFYKSNTKVNGDFIRIQAMKNIVAKQHMIDFYLASGKTIQQAAQLVGAEVDANNNIIIQESVKAKKGRYGSRKWVEVLSIKYTYIP